MTNMVEIIYKASLTYTISSRKQNFQILTIHGMVFGLFFNNIYIFLRYKISSKAFM